MKTSIDKIDVGNKAIALHLEQETPTATVEGKDYKNLHEVVKAVPELSKIENIEAFAKISNFMLKGTEFIFIEDIPAFQKQYVHRLEEDKNNPEKPPHGLHFSDFGIYRIELMHPPRVEKGHLTYFVKNDYTQIPYRVVCPFPFTEPGATAKYELLPFAHV